MASKRQPSAPPKNSSEWRPWDDDPILRDEYAQREAFAAECGYSLDAMYAHWKKNEQELLAKRGPARRKSA